MGTSEAPDRARVSELLASPHPDERIEGALSCYDLAEPSLADAVSAALAIEEDVKVRATLVKALMATTGSKGVPTVLPYLRDPDGRVRANAVEALGMIDDPTLVPHLERMMSDPHMRVAGNAIIAMARYDSLKFRDSVHALARSSRPAECQTALYVLSKFEEPWAVSLLGQMATRADNPVAAQTVKILEQLAQWRVPGAQTSMLLAHGVRNARADDEEVRVVCPPKVTRRTLPSLLRAPSPRVRIFAIQEAGQRLLPEDVVPLFLERLRDETSVHVLATLTKWIGLIGSTSHLSVLEPYLDHADDRVRANTLEGLFGRRADVARPFAARLLDDPSPRVRALAARVVAQFDRAEARAVLRTMVMGGNDAEIDSALHAMQTVDAGLALDVVQVAILRGGAAVSKRVRHILSAMAERLPLAGRLQAKFDSGSFAAQEGGYVRGQIDRLRTGNVETRLAALTQLRYCRTPQAWDVIDEVAREDGDDRVRSLAKTLAVECDRERERRVHLYELGLRMLQLYERGDTGCREVYRLCEQVLLIEQALQDGDDFRGDPVERLIVERINLLILLGERGNQLIGDGTITDATSCAIAVALNRRPSA